MMSEKVMVGTHHEGRAEIITDCGNTWFLDYYIEEFADSEGSKLLGLRVDKSTPDGVLFEREDTGAITECFETASKIVKTLARGTVTPSVLLEITDDLIESSLD